MGTWINNVGPQHFLGLGVEKPQEYLTNLATDGVMHGAGEAASHVLPRARKSFVDFLSSRLPAIDDELASEAGQGVEAYSDLPGYQAQQTPHASYELSGSTEVDPEAEGEATRGAQFGSSTTKDHRRTFMPAHPELQGKVIVHHAVEQQVLKKYPGLITPSEMHSLENLRGIPNELNRELHLSKIRIEWNKFYRSFKGGARPTKEELLRKATEIDAKYGHLFVPKL